MFEKKLEEQFHLELHASLVSSASPHKHNKLKQSYSIKSNII